MIRATGPQGPCMAPAALRQLIDDAAITQPRAAALCHAGLRTMQQWLAGDRRMPAASAELLCIALVVHHLIAPGPWLTQWVRPEIRAILPRF